MMMYCSATRPTTIIRIQTRNSISAVLRSLIAISAQIPMMGRMMGTKAWLKSLITSCFDPIDRATKMISASLAKSELWKVSPTKGMRSQRLALLMSSPNHIVTSSSAKATTSNPGAQRLYFVYAIRWQT